jgi:hypothetical protein
MRQILITKSAQRGRIVYKLTAGLVFDYMIMYLLAWTLPVISVKLILFPSRYDHSPFFLHFIFIMIDAWFIISLYFMNKLVVFQGGSFDKNKNEIMSVLKDKYPDISFTSGNPNLIRGKKKVGYLRDRIITIILDENNIYINILNTYRSTGFSFYHGLFNYFKSQRLANDIKLAVLS